MASTLSEVVITASLNLGRFTANVVSGEQLGFLAVLGSILEDLIDQADAVADSNHYAKEGAKQAMAARAIVDSLRNTRFNDSKIFQVLAEALAEVCCAG